MRQTARVSVLLILLLAGPGLAAGGVPGWLGGPPDTRTRDDRCGVYDWFLARADAQTQGLASEDVLARRRVVNVANKLVEHHRSARQPVYEAEIRYLVFGGTRAHHFTFRIEAEAVDRLLAEPCDAAQ